MKTFLIILITVLLTAGAAGGGGYYFMKNKTDKEKSLLQIQISNLQKQVDEQKIAKSANTTNWKSYSSDELGLSFKYPTVWGEPYAHLEDYSDQKELNNSYFAGKFYSVCFNKGEFCAVGFSADYKVYESAADSYYVGDKKSLDAAESDVVSDSEKSTISFIQKAEVAGVKTSTKTIFFYQAEASGIGLSSQTLLNSRTDYPGVSISTYYQGLSENLNKLYDVTGGKNDQLESEAEKELKALKSGTSDFQSQYNLYLLWLTTFSYL